MWTLFYYRIVIAFMYNPLFCCDIAVCLVLDVFMTADFTLLVVMLFYISAIKIEFFVITDHNCLVEQV